MDPQRTILIVDDDPTLRELISIQLEQEGYLVRKAENGRVGVAMVRDQQPDIVILDLLMPEMDGLEACREIRTFSDLPVLMLTARSENQDIVTGLERGADDYLAKPFNMDELLARLRALLRRTSPMNRTLIVSEGQVVINQETRDVFVRGLPIELTRTEYKLLITLARNAGKVMEHHQILLAVWGEDYNKDSDYLKVYIWHLRRKLEEDHRNPKILLNEWGVGYYIVP